MLNIFFICIHLLQHGIIKMVNTMSNDLYKYENELYSSGIKFIGGVDEVGRGPLIGDVVAACVVLPKNFILDGLTDSKKLSEKKRDRKSVV